MSDDDSRSVRRRAVRAAGRARQGPRVRPGDEVQAPRAPGRGRRGAGDVPPDLGVLDDAGEQPVGRAGPQARAHPARRAGVHLPRRAARAGRRAHGHGADRQGLREGRQARRHDELHGDGRRSTATPTGASWPSRAARPSRRARRRRRADGHRLGHHQRGRRARAARRRAAHDHRLRPLPGRVR